MKIAVYTIALNELQFVERWVNSVQEADYLVVADTGSTDGTVEALLERNVMVSKIKIKPWRFDDARNVALSLVPEDADICISMDMDEMMAPGWRQELEKNWLPNTTRIRYQYIHNFDANDNPDHVFMADKIHSRFGYRWKRPIHETIFPIDDEKIVASNDVIMWHKQDATKSRGQYLPLLELAHKEYQTDSQICYWLAREYAYKGQTESAVFHFKKYLDMPESGWADERSEAMSWLAKLLPHESLYWLRKAALESPTRRENWLNLAEYYYNKAEWVNLYAAAMEGLTITTPSGSYLDYPSAWGAKLWDLGGLGAWNIGLKTESLRLFEEATKIEPHDARIRSNYEFVKNAQ
jgi:glycosyltransferase involved in cell wall biosynthesis